MHSLSTLQLARHVNKRRAAAMWMAATLLWAGLGSATESDHEAPPGQAGRPYANMPDIAPIGIRVDKYYDIPEQAKGPEIDPAKGCRVEELGKGLYMITDGFFQSVFMVYETGIVLIDAPPNYGREDQRGHRWGLRQTDHACHLHSFARRSHCRSDERHHWTSNYHRSRGDAAPPETSCRSQATTAHDDFQG